MRNSVNHTLCTARNKGRRRFKRLNIQCAAPTANANTAGGGRDRLRALHRSYRDCRDAYGRHSIPTGDSTHHDCARQTRTHSEAALCSDVGVSTQRPRLGVHLVQRVTNAATCEAQAHDPGRVLLIWFDVHPAVQTSAGASACATTSSRGVSVHARAYTCCPVTIEVPMLTQRYPQHRVERHTARQSRPFHSTPDVRAQIFPAGSDDAVQR